MTVIEKLQMNANQANSDFVAIKNKIVEKGVEVADGTRTAEYAGKVDEVYEAGRKSQYDEFWDKYQKYGNPASFDYMFAGEGWTRDTLKPKYDIIVKGQAVGMFNANSMGGDLVELLSQLGVRLDFSQSTNISTCFSWSAFTRVGEICANIEGLYTIFGNCRELVTIDKLKVKENITYNSWFNNCFALENLTIEGVIGQNGFNVQWSTKLSKASWISIINALSETTSGLSITGSLTSVNTAFETSAGANDGSTSAEWLNLIANKNNWTVNLV
jgi:hypothetical protein